MDNAKHEQVLGLMRGAYDLHVHSLPSHVSRSLDDFELVREADAYGMAGVMIKSHYEPTIDRAWLANKYAGARTTVAYGSVTLNWPVGGLNPYAAESALRLGAKIVWAPTRDSRHSLEFGNMPGDFFDRPGLTILDQEGKVLSQVYDILDVVKKYGACLGTGHLSVEESLILCRLGVERGVRMLLTHPEFFRTRVDIDTQRDLAALGVIIEKSWYNVADASVDEDYMAQAIRQVGPEHIYLSTDRGQDDGERPAEGMKLFIASLLERGISPEDIFTMTHTNPAALVS